MAEGVGFVVFIYSFGAFCAGIPLMIINLISAIMLAIYYDHSSLGIWLATNTGVSLTICGVSMLVILVCGCRNNNNPSKENLGVMFCCAMSAPFIIFVLKSGLCIWGIVELASYQSKWNALSIFSTCIIILQLIVYACVFGLFAYRGATESSNKN